MCVVGIMFVTSVYHCLNFTWKNLRIIIAKYVQEMAEIAGNVL